MDTLYLSIMEAIASGMGDTLSLIDEDYGQLEALAEGGETADQYPITFPCVLIGTPEVQWQCVGTGTAQRGTALISVRLAFDCYDDTHHGSTQEEQTATRLIQAETLHALLHMKRFDGAAGPMVRTASGQATLPGGIKVYAMTYRVTVATSDE